MEDYSNMSEKQAVEHAHGANAFGGNFAKVWDIRRELFSHNKHEDALQAARDWCKVMRRQGYKTKRQSFSNFVSCTAVKKYPHPAKAWHQRVEFQYRDAGNYKTYFHWSVTISPEDYKPGGLQKGEEITMGEHGTPTQSEFFRSTLHPMAYDPELDHNILEVYAAEEGPQAYPDIPKND